MAICYFSFLSKIISFSLKNNEIKKRKEKNRHTRVDTNGAIAPIKFGIIIKVRNFDNEENMQCNIG